ncbi:MAG: hypothetical protein DRO36_04410, partial [Candidatus Hecatellales archaeon]
MGVGADGSIAANKMARELRREIAEEKIEITIPDKNDVNVNQAGFTFLPFDLYTYEDISKPRQSAFKPPKIGLMGLLSALREEVQRGMGIVIELLRA